MQPNRTTFSLATQKKLPQRSDPVPNQSLTEMYQNQLDLQKVVLENYTDIDRFKHIDLKP